MDSILSDVGLNLHLSCLFTLRMYRRTLDEVKPGWSVPFLELLDIVARPHIEKSVFRIVCFQSLFA